MPLHTDYRPNCLEDLIGNDSVKDSLESVFGREKDFPHAFLFHGPSGSGKTTLSRIIGNMLECDGSDFAEYNMAESRGIDTVREIDQNCRYAPLNSKFKIYLMDEFHRATTDAQSALLKILEDAPSHVVFLLCTTEPEKVLKTIRTRCMTYQTKLLTPQQITKLLKSVLEKEKVEDYPDKLIKEIVKVSEGCPRSALVLLDSVIDILDEQKALQAISSFNTSETTINEIGMLLIEKGSFATKWKEMKKLINGIEEEPESVRYAVLGYLTKVLLNNGDDRIADMIEVFFDSWQYSKKAGMVYSLYNACRF